MEARGGAKLLGRRHKRRIHAGRTRAYGPRSGVDLQVHNSNNQADSMASQANGDNDEESDEAFVHLPLRSRPVHMIWPRWLSPPFYNFKWTSCFCLFSKL